MASSKPDPVKRGHGPDGRFVTSEATALRDAEACRLRTRGMGYLQIAKELGFADASGAHQAVQRGLQAIRQESAEDVRRIELERLDGLLDMAREIAEAAHPTVSAGKVLDVPDNALRLAAMDRLLRIQERRARLLGLDAPQRISVDAENIGREIGELIGQLGQLNQSDPSGAHDNSDYRADG